MVSIDHVVITKVMFVTYYSFVIAVTIFFFPIFLRGAKHNKIALFPVSYK
jgi:hypothetical protein